MDRHLENHGDAAKDRTPQTDEESVLRHRDQALEVKAVVLSCELGVDSEISAEQLVAAQGNQERVQANVGLQLGCA